MMTLAKMYNELEIENQLFECPKLMSAFGTLSVQAMFTDIDVKDSMMTLTTKTKRLLINCQQQQQQQIRNRLFFL